MDLQTTYLVKFFLRFVLRHEKLLMNLRIGLRVLHSPSLRLHTHFPSFIPAIHQFDNSIRDEGNLYFLANSSGLTQANILLALLSQII